MGPETADRPWTRKFAPVPSVGSSSASMTRRGSTDPLDQRVRDAVDFEEWRRRHIWLAPGPGCRHLGIQTLASRERPKHRQPAHIRTHRILFRACAQVSYPGEAAICPSPLGHRRLALHQRPTCLAGDDNWARASPIRLRRALPWLLRVGLRAIRPLLRSCLRLLRPFHQPRWWLLPALPAQLRSKGLRPTRFELAAFG